jgi:hypothetical protein
MAPPAQCARNAIAGIANLILKSKFLGFSKVRYAVPQSIAPVTALERRFAAVIHFGV